MPDVHHIPLERMTEVIVKVDAFFTPAEVSHLQGCKNCLAEFERALDNQ